MEEEKQGIRFPITLGFFLGITLFSGKGLRSLPANPEISGKLFSWDLEGAAGSSRTVLQFKCQQTIALSMPQAGGVVTTEQGVVDENRKGIKWTKCIVISGDASSTTNFI